MREGIFSFLMLGICAHGLQGLEVPTQLRVMTEPAEALEMAPFGIQPRLYLADVRGKFIAEVGTESDPWLVTAAKAGGAGNLVNNVTCPFIAGYCNFTNLAVDSEGTNFTIEFALTYSTTTGVSSVESSPFNVGPRPLAIKVTSLPVLARQKQGFTAVVEIWDEAIDVPANSSTTPPAGVTCSVELEGEDQGVRLMGTTTVPVVGGTATFGDLKTSDYVDKAHLKATCDDSEDFIRVTSSDLFSTHPYPESGLLKQKATGFHYTGVDFKIGSVLDAVSAVVSGGSGGSARKKRELSGNQEARLFAPRQLKITPDMIASWPIY